MSQHKKKNGNLPPLKEKKVEQI